MELETSIAQPFMKTAEIWRHCSISSRASPATHMEPKVFLTGKEKNRRLARNVFIGFLEKLSDLPF